MSYYVTDRRTGEMTELLEPLRREPRGKVKRLPSVHVSPRQAVYRSGRANRHPVPLNDLLSGLAACVLAFAVLTALA